MTDERSDALVFFGATGDLAYKKIFPSLATMIRRDGLNLPIIGVAKAGWTLDQLKARAQDSIDKHGGARLGSRRENLFAAALHRRRLSGSGDVRPVAQNARYAQSGRSTTWRFRRNCSPRWPKPGQSGCAKGARRDGRKTIRPRPGFGRGAEWHAASLFPEESIFRIDHILGKEPVQNLVYFRFANPSVEAGWNAEHLASVEITMAEDFGVAGRGKFYDEAGAIRDVVQNHMLQVIACLAMDCPQGNDHDSLRDAARPAARGGPPARNRPTSCAGSFAAIATSAAWRPARRSKRSRRIAFSDRK